MCTRVPLIIRVPENISTLEKGTVKGSLCHQPISLLDLYKTLTDLAGLPQKKGLDGQSLLPLLKNQDADWREATLTSLSHPDNYALSGKEWRYIHYRDGTEELYHITKDPYEWNNLAKESKYENKLIEFRKLAPQ